MPHVNVKSHSLAVGHSYLPARINNIPKFITSVRGAIVQHPDVAAEILLAATDRLHRRFSSQENGTALMNALLRLVQESCLARDQSMV